MLDFWLRVKDKLDFQNMTQRDLAEKINESYNTLQSWINRDRLPNAEQAVKIAPKSAACLDSLGWVYYKMGLYKDALQYLNDAEQIAPDNVEIANHIKSVKLKAGIA